VLAIVGAVVLLITLVALGGYFLYRSLPGNTAAGAPDAAGTAADARSDATEMGTLHIRVTGDSSDVLVRVPGGEVVTDTTMRRGEHADFDQPELDVTIGDPAAVEVYVYGELQDISGKEPGYSFSVEPRDPA
jgi:hypothetical protein